MTAENLTDGGGIRDCLVSEFPSFLVQYIVNVILMQISGMFFFDAVVSICRIAIRNKIFLVSVQNVSQFGSLNC